MKIVVLLSTYNGEEYLTELLESIRKQTIADKIFIYVRDDGSSDKTITILERYRSTGNLEYYQGKNIGSARSFYELLCRAPNADYYAFADQDDVWLPSKIENAILALKDIKGPAVYGTKKIVVDKNLKRLNKMDTEPQLAGPLNVFLHRNEIYGCTMCMNDALRTIYLENTEIPEDVYHDSWIVKLAAIFGTIIFSDNAQILYRQHGHNVVGIQNGGYELFWQRIKNFDITLRKYRQRNYDSRISRAFLDAYGDKIPQQNKELLYDIAYIHDSWKCRIRLFLKEGFSKNPFYEYLVYKIFMLLGWY